ncbi:MAG: PadR family transcriptional regulator [Phycisphaerales bacterium]|nr:PadR family transcriptional regulator [Phycisphaerales bacterium]
MARPTTTPGTQPLLQGTLDMMILKTLATDANHGYGIARRIKQISDDVLAVEEGSLYPALHRLEKRGYVESERRRSETNRQAKYYRLTAAGRRRLASDTEAWRSVSRAIGKVMGSARIHRPEIA